MPTISLALILVFIPQDARCSALWALAAIAWALRK